MPALWFNLRQTPDLTQPRYAALPHGEPQAVLALFEPSLRMLHRLGSSYGLQLRLCIQADPAPPPGQRLRMALGFAGSEQALQNAPVWSTWLATPLAPYFAALMAPSTDPLEDKTPGGMALQGCEVARLERYWPLAELGDDAFARFSELPPWLHAAYPWEGNASCRLLSVLQLMQSLEVPCVLTLALEPSEGESEYEALHAAYAHSLARLAGGSYKDALGRSEYVKPGPVAEQLRSLRQDLLDKLRCEPCFTMQLRCYAPTRDLARLLADTIMAEALSEGPHSSWPLPANLDFFEPAPLHLVSTAPPQGVQPPPALQRLPQVFALSEVAALFRLPVLHEGEQLDLRKETWPVLTAQGQAQLLLGHAHTPGQEAADPIYLPLDALVKHTLVVGVPGSGKTNTLMSLARQLWCDYQRPFLVLEPAKREYRGLLNLPGCSGQVLLFAPARAAASEWLTEGELNPLALRINPLEMPLGFAIGEHCTQLAAIFDAAFGLFNPLPAMLESAVETAYVERGWRREDIATAQAVAQRGFPAMPRLVELLRELADATDYVGENAATVQAGLEYRFGRLVDGPLADVFGAAASTLRPEEWLTRPIVVELESLGEANANMLSLLLQTYLREALTVQQEEERQTGTVREAGHKLRHVLFLEEAHNLIGPHAARQQGAEGQADPKAAATAWVVKMLAEVRALGLGIVIGDQLPSALAPEVLKNTSIRICHRLTAPDDRAQMQQSMNASALQLEYMASQTSGHALVSFEGVRKPFAIAMLAADGAQARHNAAISDQALLTAIARAAPGWQAIDERFAANALLMLVLRWEQLQHSPWQGITPAEVLAAIEDPASLHASHLLLAELMQYWLAATVRCAARLQLWLQIQDGTQDACLRLQDKIHASNHDLAALQQAASRFAASPCLLACELGRTFAPGKTPSPHLGPSATQARWWYQRSLALARQAAASRPLAREETMALARAHQGLWQLSTRAQARKSARQTHKQRNLHHLRQAAELGLPAAQVDLALELLAKQPLQARRWLEQAAAQNYAPAHGILMEISTPDGQENE